MVDIGGFALGGGLVVVLDQILKSFLVSALPTGVVRIGSFIRIAPRRAPGTFASRLGVPARLLVVGWLAALASLLVAIANVPWLSSGLAPFALGAALGGAGSNVIDQVARGGVVDYVDLRVWPAFNLADVAIVAGVVTALLAAVAESI